MATLLIQLENFPRERELISRMILAYGELEFAMMDLLAATLNDSTAAVRTLFQLRSESNRQAVVEAIAQPSFNRVGLGGQFSEAMAAVGHCKNYRNQYAHCHWAECGGILYFTQLETTAKKKGANCTVLNIPITVQLLEKQWKYFEFTDHMLLWLDNKYREKSGLPIRGEGEIPQPRRVPPPKRDSRGEIQERQ